MEWPSGIKTKKIVGLPAMPKLKMEKKPASRGASRVRAGKLVLDFHNGMLMGVENPTGKLGAVAIVQTAYPGFTVRSDKSPYSILGYGYRKAEKLAVRLAMRGHKRVAIRT